MTNELTPSDPMPIGKHKGKPLAMVPAKTFPAIYANKELLNRYPLLKAYIEKHFSKLYPNINPDLTRPTTPFCKTGKIVYLDQAAAKTALKLIKQDMRPGKKPNGSYQCPNCKYWHLTSKAKT